MLKGKFLLIPLLCAGISLPVQMPVVFAQSQEEAQTQMKAQPREEAQKRDQIEINTQNVSAGTNNNAGDRPAPDLPPSTENSFPYEKKFVISAYYSPLPNQRHYVRGSYWADVKLNGRGVHGADGADVYPGMIAAPKSYPFGTKMKIPGIGIAAVHDRGSAIVRAGEQNQPYDRLDIWMGYGDIGLQRALQWGKRTTEVAVYGIDPNLKEEVTLEGYSEAEKAMASAALAAGLPVNTLYDSAGSAKNVSSRPQVIMFNADLSLNDEDEAVEKLQKALNKLNYYSGEIKQFYDENTRQAVIKFQIDAGILDSVDDFGAGYFGPQTRLRLTEAILRYQQALQKHLPSAGLHREDRGNEVKKLQEVLVKLGYQADINGIYDEKTVDALFQFQKDNGVVDTETEHGAGVFGPRTMAVLATAYVGGNFEKTATESQIFKQFLVFLKDLKVGDSGQDVRELQAELAQMNLLGIDSTGFYGKVTAHAVFKFQQISGIVKREDEDGAGVFGPATRNKLHSLLAQRKETRRMIADKQKQNKKKLVALAANR